MNASEFRIGNIVDLYGTNAIIQAIDFSTGFAISKGKPIPLSEEWILKAGFKKVGRLFYHESFWACELSSNNELRFEDLDNLYVKYVHQLQNLFYSLVGEYLVFFN